MKPTFTETVNDASETRFVSSGQPAEATEPKPKARPRAAANPEEVSDADPT